MNVDLLLEAGAVRCRSVKRCFSSPRSGPNAPPPGLADDVLGFLRRPGSNTDQPECVAARAVRSRTGAGPPTTFAAPFAPILGPRRARPAASSTAFCAALRSLVGRRFGSVCTRRAAPSRAVGEVRPARVSQLRRCGLPRPVPRASSSDCFRASASPRTARDVMYATRSLMLCSFFGPPPRRPTPASACPGART